MPERIQKLRLSGVKRREQILAAAAEAFAESGFRGTSLADVAARVGVSQPGLLHHYPNKQALILAVLERRDEEDQLYLREISDKETPGVAALYTLCMRNAGRPELVRLYMVTAAESLDPTHPAHEFFQNRFRRIRGLVAERVAHDQEGGLLPRELDPLDTAAELIALMDGLQMQWLKQPSIDMCGIFSAYLARLAASAGVPAVTGE